MKPIIVDRKRIVGNWFKFQHMRGVGHIGWKIAIGRYELRLYRKKIGIK